jgi:hypothetical protein
MIAWSSDGELAGAGQSYDLSQRTRWFGCGELLRRGRAKQYGLVERLHDTKRLV